MTEQERLMYELLGKISSSNAPIVFKGGLITKIVLEQNGFCDLQRATVDIDANWIGSPPTMEFLTATLTAALGELQDKYTLVPFREYGEKKSAGLNVLDKASGTKVISMDIEINPIISSTIYHFGEISIKGVLADEIIADKICAISTDLIYKHRAKDLVDAYALSQCIDVNVKKVLEVCKTKNRVLQSFDGLLNRKSDVEHAYNKLKRIEGKPEFSQVYDYLCRFVHPFVMKDDTEKVWDPNRTVWTAVTQYHKLRATDQEIAALEQAGISIQRCKKGKESDGKTAIRFDAAYKEQAKMILDGLCAAKQKR